MAYFLILSKTGDKSWRYDFTHAPIPKKEIPYVFGSYTTASLADARINRTKYLDKRKIIMQKWADYCDEIKLAKLKP